MAWVQSTASGATATNVTNISVTLGSSATAGNHIIVDAAIFNTAGPSTVSTVADNKGNGNYSSAKEVTFNSHVRLIQYYKNNIGTGGSSFQVTVTMNASQNGLSISAHEYSGISGGPGTDVNSNTGTGTAVTSGAVNPAVTSMYHATGAHDGSATTFGTNAPWTERSKVDVTNSVQVHAGQDQNGASGSQNASWTINTSSPWAAVIAAYPESGGGGGVTVKTLAALGVG